MLLKTCFMEEAGFILLLCKIPIFIMFSFTISAPYE